MWLEAPTITLLERLELLVQIIDVKLLRVQLEKSSKLLLPCQNLGVKQMVHNGEVSQFPGWHHDVRQMSVSQVFYFITYVHTICTTFVLMSFIIEND